MAPDPPVAGRHAYGLRLLGLDHVPELSTASAHAADITVEVGQRDDRPPGVTPPDRDRSVTLLADGRHLMLDRAAGRATFFGPAISTDQLAHPYLGPIATRFSRWAGREVFHAGAVVAGDRAWGVLGPRTAGKSSLLAALARRGVPVLTDDILVTDGVSVYAGPRCVDLREPLPGAALPAVVVRLGTRLRVLLPPVPARVPLGGWLFLGWGDHAVAPLASGAVLVRLAGLRSFGRLPSDPQMLLRIAGRPAWELCRPREWAALPHTVDRLLDTLGACADRAA